MVSDSTAAPMAEISSTAATTIHYFTICYSTNEVNLCACAGARRISLYLFLFLRIFMIILCDGLAMLSRHSFRMNFVQEFFSYRPCTTITNY